MRIKASVSIKILLISAIIGTIIFSFIFGVIINSLQNKIIASAKETTFLHAKILAKNIELQTTNQSSHDFEKLITEFDLPQSTNVLITNDQGETIASTNGNYLHSNKINLGLKQDSSNILLYIKEGAQFVEYGTDENNNKIIIALCPIFNTEGNNHSVLISFIKEADIIKNSFQKWKILLAFSLGLLAMVALIYVLTLKLINPLRKAGKTLSNLTEGSISKAEQLNIQSGDEIEDFAQAINEVVGGLKKTSDFANQIEQGIYNHDYKPLSPEDELGNALFNLQESILKTKETETARAEEDKKANWETQGIAKFNDILRADSTNIKQLSFDVISNLVSYMNANQGALFIINDTDEDDVFFELTSAIAYSREKLLKKKFRISEGLIGRCAYEMKSIYMTEIPQNYINIGSGLGTANPTSLVLVPLILNNVIFGVIELASFNTLEDYQIQLIEKVGDNIASTISSVKINEKTSNLLNQSKHQAEELAAQEEEMRQNMEELQATQEESQRREHEMNDIINALSEAALTVEYDMNGDILNVNKKYIELLGSSADQVIGKNHSEGYAMDGNKKIEYNKFWNGLKQGIPQVEISKLNFNNKEIWLKEHYTPVSLSEGETPYKVFKISFDITEQILLEEKLQHEIETKTTIPQNESALDNKADELKTDEGKIDTLTQQLKALEQKTKKAEAANIPAKPTKTITSPKKESNTTNDSTGEENIKAIEWCAEIVLGVDEIDEQHQQLIQLANTVFAVFTEDKPKKECKEALRNFIDFTSYHFGTEEHYFNQIDFKQSSEHINEHKAFLKKMKQFQDEYNKSKEKDWKSEITYIAEWLPKHMNEIDKQYIEEFKKAGL